MKFNINNYVRVRLTEHGRRVFREEYQKYRITNEPEVDEEGYTKFQLWELMNIYGEHIHMGGPNLFDTDIILGPES